MRSTALFHYGGECGTLYLVGQNTTTREKESEQMATKEQTCEERISEYLANLEESVTDILKGYYGETEGEGEDQDNARGFEEWNNFPLAVTTRQETKIELSWGGPSDFLTVSHDGAQVIAVTYHFQDWFDGATREVSEDSKVWEYARTVIEARKECGY